MGLEKPKRGKFGVKTPNRAKFGVGNIQWNWKHPTEPKMGLPTAESQTLGSQTRNRAQLWGKNAFGWRQCKKNSPKIHQKHWSLGENALKIPSIKGQRSADGKCIVSGVDVKSWRVWIKTNDGNETKSAFRNAIYEENRHKYPNVLYFGRRTAKKKAEFSRRLKFARRVC